MPPRRLRRLTGRIATFRTTPRTYVSVPLSGSSSKPQLRPGRPGPVDVSVNFELKWVRAEGGGAGAASGGGRAVRPALPAKGGVGLCIVIRLWVFQSSPVAAPLRPRAKLRWAARRWRLSKVGTKQHNMRLYESWQKMPKIWPQSRIAAGRCWALGTQGCCRCRLATTNRTCLTSGSVRENKET